MPVIVDVPETLTAQEPEPRAPAQPVNDDLLDLIDALKAWGRLGWCRVEDIANLGPGEDQHEACAKVRGR